MHPTNSGKRQQRPNCVTCGHSLSFHGAELTKCKALGCNCAVYVGVTQLGFDTVSLDEAAELLKVADANAVLKLVRHADAPDGLELEWVPESMVDTRLGTEMVWRARRTAIEEYLTAVRDS